ncbi:hypothetical protein [Streptomonospora litoralis]|uniref:Uncharacterized protein n=1 Tax=Streptomonospora litoralis TaxID=2498135 RepID=A0A4P6Q1K3_9ACTN|nr:hypothetical protein [Streptomonospora litoralis]QBI54373.1 hypothetical protein EKD16_12955 [Streptomonospora litoralis]
MPTTITHGHHPPTQSSGRPHHLTHLAATIRAHGGTAVVALSHTAHPVLYVRHRDRTIPVVLVQDIRGGWSFVWGRTGWADSSQTEALAAYLADPGAPATPTGTPPATTRRPAVSSSTFSNTTSNSKGA